MPELPAHDVAEQPITLELEHIDGNSTNYDEDNLLLLCCNCHSQTDTWRRKKPPPPLLNW